MRRWGRNVGLVGLLAAALAGLAVAQTAPSWGTAPPRSHNLDEVATPLPPGRIIASSHPLPSLPTNNQGVPDDTLGQRPPAKLPLPSGKVKPALYRPDPAKADEPTIVRVSAGEPAGPPPPPDPPSPSASAPPPAPTPSTGGNAVAVEVVGPATVAPGQAFAFEIVVRNTSRATVGQVRLEEQWQPGTRLVHADPQPEVRNGRMTWNVGNLEAGGSRRIQVELQAPTDGEVVFTPTVSYTAVHGLRAKVVRPTLEVQLTGPEAAQKGDRVVFQLRVVNNGTTPLRQVSLQDKVPPGLRHPQGSHVGADLGELAPGQSRSVTLETVAIQAGRHVNEVEATAEDVPPASARAAVVVTEPALVVQVDGPKQGQAEGDVDVRIAVVPPRGSGALSNLTVRATAPEGLVIDAVSTGGQMDASRRQAMWSFAAVAAGQSPNVVVRLKPRTPGDWNLQVTATAPSIKEGAASHPIRVEGTPRLAVVARDFDDPLDVGAETTYEVRVVNQGSAAARNVRVNLVVPDGLALVRWEGPAQAVVQGQQVAFEPLGQMTPRADALYRLRVKAVRPGDQRFRADVSCEGQPSVRQEESTQVKPALSAYPPGRSDGWVR